MHDIPLFPHPLTAQEAGLKNPLALAFIGDTVWDLLVRSRLLRSAARVNALHKSAISQVNAGAQAKALGCIVSSLSEEEAAIVKRGQNANAKHAVPKNQNPVDYSAATGLEALFGYLYLVGRNIRLLELFDIAMPMP